MKMAGLSLVVDGTHIETKKGVSIMEAAHKAGIYIPGLCYHPDLPSFNETISAKAVYQGQKRFDCVAAEASQGCQLCLVKIEGVQGFRTACSTQAVEGMVVHTNTDEIRDQRRANLAAILANHPHTCLVCANREGCDLKRCTMNVSEKERCCWKFGICELRKVAEYVGITREDMPRYIPQGLPTVDDEPLFKRDYNLCIGCGRCVRACQNLRGVGALGCVTENDRSTVGFLTPTAIVSGCQFCGTCVEVCPTGALRDKGIQRAEREEALVPCRSVCPAGIDIPRYVHLVREGKFTAAAQVIMEKVPFPAVIGRVCTRPCENVCRRKELDEPISIAALKRFAADQYNTRSKVDVKIGRTSNRKVAIIGSGPAGLSAASYLAKLGHPVTIFESLPYPGGMMRLGIPEYRLPRGILDNEIAEIGNLGVEIVVNKCTQSLEELFQQGYEGIFVATGAHESVRMGIQGEDAPNVLQGLYLLGQVNLGVPIKLSGSVLVVGGGNVAIDAARVALRLGAKDVRILYRRTRREMPAGREDVEDALGEGVKIDLLSSPISIAGNSQLKVQCIRLRLGEPDETGRGRPIPIEGSEFFIECNTVIIAIGQRPRVPDSWKLKVRKDNTIEVNPDNLATSKQGVYAGGDAVLGPSSVIEAVVAGKRAANSLDRYLGGGGLVNDVLAMPPLMKPWIGPDRDFASRHKVNRTSLWCPGEQLASFKETELGFDGEQAILEAKRCLRCDLRLQISSPILPPERWVKIDDSNLASVPAVEGVYQLADGERKIIIIKGSANLRQELREQVTMFKKAKYFAYDKDLMYTRRESEMIQQFLQRNGRLPSGNLGFDEDELP